jgi:hypothetical protein
MVKRHMQITAVLRHIQSPGLPICRGYNHMIRKCTLTCPNQMTCVYVLTWFTCQIFWTQEQFTGCETHTNTFVYTLIRREKLIPDKAQVSFFKPEPDYSLCFS